MSQNGHQSLTKELLNHISNLDPEEGKKDKFTRDR